MEKEAVEASENPSIDRPEVPLLKGGAAPVDEAAKDGEAKGLRELRAEDSSVCGADCVANLLYAAAFLLGLCLALLIFARDPGMLAAKGSWMEQKLLGVQKPFLWLVTGSAEHLANDEFLSRCVERWQSMEDFEVRLVHSKNFDVWLSNSSLPKRFRYLTSSEQSDVLKVALLAHFGGLSVDVSSLPVQKDAMLQIWNSLQGSKAEALGTYSYHQQCQWNLGMWFLAAKKGSKFMQYWMKLMLEEIGNSKGISSPGSNPTLLYLAKSLFHEDESFRCEEIPSGFAWLLQYQAELNRTDSGFTPILRARSRCASDMLSVVAGKGAVTVNETRHRKRPVVQDPTGYLAEWNAELGQEAEGCYLDLHNGFEDLRGKVPALMLPQPQHVPMFHVDGALTIKELVPTGVPGRWLQQ